VSKRLLWVVEAVYCPPEDTHPYLEAWWPPGDGLGYEHTFTHQARDLLCAVAEGRDPSPSFADGLQVQRVLAAVEHSARENSVLTPVPQQGGTDADAPILHPLHRTVGGPAAGTGVPPRC
jgi:hypothetical protein